jgi:lipopolysaccharide export system permease protein
MQLSRTLNFYLGRQFFTGIFYAFICIAIVVFFVELVELLRRSANRENIGFFLVLQMASLKLPSMMQKLLPFAALFGGIWTIHRLTRSNELVVARSAGVSAWQFLAPAMAVAIFIGAFAVGIFNPFASALISRFERLEARLLEGRNSVLDISTTGLWLRQADGKDQSVVHARKVSADGTVFYQVSIFLFKNEDTFVGRVEAQKARLTPGFWILSNAVLARPGEPGQKLVEYRLPTGLTIDEIQDSFARPDTLSFWSLPHFIETLEKAGFSAVRHKLHWHTLISLPILLCAMILLAATFSLRQLRFGGAGLLLASGVLTGFMFYFLTDVVYAFGLAGSLPVALAAWTPVGICALLALAMLFHLEDG